MTYEFDTVLVEVDDGVATLTLNRPDAMNAFDHTMDREFHEAMWLLDADEAVRVIVVTGAGRAFCSGIDMSGGADVFGADAHEAHDAAQGVDSDSVPDRSAFWTMRTPVIGAINGAAVGAGLTVPMLFDLRIVAADAKLGFVFVRRGVVPDANITGCCPRLVGVERALELLHVGPDVQRRGGRGDGAGPQGRAARTTCWPRPRPSPASSPPTPRRPRRGS